MKNLKYVLGLLYLMVIGYLLAAFTFWTFLPEFTKLIRFEISLLVFFIMFLILLPNDTNKN